MAGVLAEAVERCSVWLLAATLSGVVLLQPAVAMTGQVVAGTSDLSGFASSRLQQGAVLVYRRGGGLLPATGAVQEWAIFSDGRVQGSTGEVFRIAARAVSELLAAVINLKVDGTDVRCRDCYTYHLELRRESTIKRLIVVEGAELPTNFLRRMDTVHAAITAARNK